MVLEVTDDKGLPKAERKKKQVNTAPNKSHRAKVLKLADKDNKSQTFGFNAQTEVYGDMLAAGIVDPAKVVRVALQGAADRSHDHRGSQEGERFGDGRRWWNGPPVAGLLVTPMRVRGQLSRDVPGSIPRRGVHCAEP